MLLLTRRMGQSIFIGIPEQKIEVVVMDFKRKGYVDYVTLGFDAPVWVPIWRDDVISRAPKEARYETE